MEKQLQYYGVIDEINYVQIEHKVYLIVILDCVSANQLESLFFSTPDEVNLFNIIDKLTLESILIQIPVELINSLFKFNNLSEGRLVKIYDSNEPVEVKSQRLSFFRTEDYQGEDYSYEILDGRIKPYKRLLDALNLGASAKEYIKPKEAEQLLNNINFSPEKEQFVTCYNVGQGNAVCLSEKDGQDQSKPLLYFDIGGGANFNRFTYPDADTKSFKVAENTLFILSHWDEDHYETAKRDPKLIQNRIYIAPVQRVTFRNLKFINNLINNGNLILIPSGFASIVFPLGKLIKCIGFDNKKNDSGLALVLNLKKEKNLSAILLPGDAQYKCIPDICNESFDAIMATHHGGRLYRHICLPIPSTKKGCIAYSYGNDNIYSHPLDNSVQIHENENWGVSALGNITRLDTIHGDILFSYVDIGSISCENKIDVNSTNKFADISLNRTFKIDQILSE